MKLKNKSKYFIYYVQRMKRATSDSLSLKRHIMQQNLSSQTVRSNLIHLSNVIQVNNSGAWRIKQSLTPTTGSWFDNTDVFLRRTTCFFQFTLGIIRTTIGTTYWRTCGSRAGGGANTTRLSLAHFAYTIVGTYPKFTRVSGCWRRGGLCYPRCGSLGCSSISTH